jgi:hypothetical protein
LPTPSARLGLLKPSEADPFVTDDIAANWQKLDDYPGVYVCTSSSRPAWTTPQAGMLISETDTGLLWRWSGSAWVRTAPSGRLRTNSGALATAARTTLFSTSSSAVYVVALTLANVVVPDGGRPIRIEATWTSAVNANGFFFGAIVRSAAVGGPNVANPRRIIDGDGGTHVAEDVGLVPGIFTYSYQVRAANGGTAQLGDLVMSATEA